MCSFSTHRVGVLMDYGSIANDRRDEDDDLIIRDHMRGRRLIRFSTVVEIVDPVERCHFNC